MTEKSAIVLDTNFVIENMSELSNLHKKLSENYNVYITEVSIKERISQKYIDLKSKYIEIENFKNKQSNYIIVQLKRTFDERFKSEEKYTIEGYNKEFGDYIIKLNPDNNLFNTVLDRVSKKIAPFSNDKNASDKGLKDTLIWLSMLQYFKDNDKEINIIFITNDKGFLNRIDELQQEFNTVTGKSIEIKNNSHYLVLLGEEKSVAVEEIKPKSELTDIEKQSIRERIEGTINDMCNIENYDYWGNQQTERTFTSNERFDVNYTEKLFDSLKTILDDHIFENQINASSVLSLDDRIEDNYPIPMQALDEVNKLYENIKDKYSEFINPFYSAVCEILNRNYVVKNTYSAYEDEDIPF